MVPLHSIGLGFVADLIEPALRVIIEETGYDRSIPYGQPTPFRLFPVFDPIKLAVDVLAAIPAGIEQALNNLGGGSMLAPTSTETTSTLAMSFASADPPATVDLTKDGTTDPVSGSTTSNGADTTLQKTGVETEGDASGTNATQSNATEIKQEDTTQQDERRTPRGPRRTPPKPRRTPREPRRTPREPQRTPPKPQRTPPKPQRTPRKPRRTPSGRRRMRPGAASRSPSRRTIRRPKARRRALPASGTGPPVPRHRRIPTRKTPPDRVSMDDDRLRPRTQRFHEPGRAIAGRCQFAQRLVSLRIFAPHCDRQTGSIPVSRTSISQFRDCI